METFVDGVSRHNLSKTMDILDAERVFFGNEQDSLGGGLVVEN